MSDRGDSIGPAVAVAPVLTAAHLAGWVDRLARVDTTAPDAALIDQISELERVKSACAAAQATLTVAFVTSRTDRLTAAQQRDERTHRSIAAQIALARRDSPARGGRHVGLAKALTREMPHAFTALSNGQLSEWRATLLLRETACLSVEHRTAVDTELADTYPAMGDRQTAAAAARIAQRLDPQHWVARHRKAVTDRRVTIRPAPDTMSNLGALLDVAHGVAVYAALDRYATTAKAIGDPRTRQQLMADELVTRITNPTAATCIGEPFISHPPISTTPTPTGEPGSRTRSGKADSASTGDSDTSSTSGRPSSRETDTTGSDPGERPSNRDAHPGDAATDDDGPGIGAVPAGVTIDIQLVMTDRTLLDGDDEPAHLTGYGPIPAPLARGLLRNAGPTITTWVRRLFTDPDTRHLITADARRRTFSHSARQFLIARDQSCRTPYCDAPIRHADHRELAKTATTPNRHPAGITAHMPTAPASSSPRPPDTPPAATRPHHHDPNPGKSPHPGPQQYPHRRNLRRDRNLRPRRHQWRQRTRRRFPDGPGQRGQPRVTKAA